MTAPSSAEIDYIVVWSGTASHGQTLDSSHSYLTVQCDDSQTLFVSGHLYRTNLPNQQFHPKYKLDGSAPIPTSVTFTTGADGTGDFAFSVEGIAPGSHTVVVEINLVSSDLSYFMDSIANSGGPGVPFACP